TFSGNHTNYGGGAIRAAWGAELVIDSSKFLNNWVSTTDSTSHNGDGGAIYSSATSVTIKNSLFEGNEARESSLSNDGGAIIFSTNKSVNKISSTIFRNNTAGSGVGGAIYNDSTLSIDSSIFEGNSSKNNSGAIHFTAWDLAE